MTDVTVESLGPHLLRPMSTGEREAFLALCRVELEGGFLSDVEGLREHFAAEGKITFALDLTLSRLAMCEPGRAFSAEMFCYVTQLGSAASHYVQWANYAARRGYALGRAATLGDFAVDFPSGVPTEEGYAVAWRAQKRTVEGRATVNAMDGTAAWARPRTALASDPWPRRA